MPESRAKPLLSVSELTKTFSSGPVWKRRVVQAVRGVSFDVEAGTTYGIVGESGSGKSTVGRLLARLLTPTSGTVSFDGTNIDSLHRAQLKEWKQNIGFVFQDPYGSLDSRMSVGQILSQPLKIHGVPGAKARTLELLDEVGLPSAAYSRYPHEFSGGQRQRIAIARALALKPKMIIADEPVSALDVSVQAQVLNLFKDIQEAHSLTYVFISHDLDVVEFISDRIGVMYLGELVESGPARSVFRSATHPYTQALLAAAPTMDEDERNDFRLQGEIPSADNPPTGCSFHTRCPRAEALCERAAPEVVSLGQDGHWAACHFAADGPVPLSMPSFRSPMPSEVES